MLLSQPADSLAFLCSPYRRQIVPRARAQSLARSPPVMQLYDCARGIIPDLFGYVSNAVCPRIVFWDRNCGPARGPQCAAGQCSPQSGQFVWLCGTMAIVWCGFCRLLIDPTAPPTLSLSLSIAARQPM